MAGELKKTSRLVSRLATAPRWVLLGVMVGVVSGLGAVVFFFALESVTHYAFTTLAHMPVPVPEGEKLFDEAPVQNPVRWLFFLLPIIGGLISGFLVYRYAPEAEGHGTDAMIDAFHNKQGKIRARVPFIKSLATIATLGLGGSAGREGPIAQIGAGFGSWISERFGLSVKERRILLIAGTAGGLGAIFRSPLGGAITAIEVLYSEDFETEALIPSIISSVTAYAIFTSIFGFNKIFSIPAFTWTNPVELPFYVILGLLCVPFGLFYVRFFYFIRDTFRKIRIPKMLLPALGGLGVGVIGFFIPNAYGSGWGTIQLALFGKLAMTSMLLILLAKIITTSLTIGSGGSGGVFGPTLFIGGMLGGVVGSLVNTVFPGLLAQPEAFVLVGMSAFFAGVANAPIGAMLMSCEMTGGYDLLVPLMLVSGIAILFSRKWSIYEKQVKDKFSSPAHIGDLTINVLEEMKVKNAYLEGVGTRALPNNMTFGQFRRLIVETDENYFPVQNGQGVLIGTVSIKSTRTGIFEQGLDNLVLLSDIVSPVVTTTPDENLYNALIKFLKFNYNQIPVVDKEDPNKILGTLRHEDLIYGYHKEVLARKKSID